MSQVALSPTTPSQFWYYLDYLNPRILISIYTAVTSRIWTGPPQRDENAIELEEVDSNGIFQRPLHAVHIALPTQGRILVDPIHKSVYISPELLNQIKEDSLLRRLIGESAACNLSQEMVMKFCRDPVFLNRAVYSAHKNNSPLYQLLRDTYTRDFKELPLRIDLNPVKIELEKVGEEFYLRCQYEGNFVKKDSSTIAFEAYCSYNLNNPEISRRSIFINHRQDALL